MKLLQGNWQRETTGSQLPGVSQDLGPKVCRLILFYLSFLRCEIVSASSPMPQSSMPLSEKMSRLGSENLSTEDTEELIIAKKNPEVTKRVWSGILKNRGFEVRDGKLERENKNTSHSGASDLGDESSKSLPKVTKPKVTRGESLLLKLQRTRSFVASNDNKESPSDSMTFESNRSSGSKLLSRTVSESSSGPVLQSFTSTSTAENMNSQQRNSLFTNKTFHLRGEANTPAERHLEESGRRE